MQLTADKFEHYREQGGHRCPFCNSTALEGEGIDIENGHASQEVTCHGCHASWYDVYYMCAVQIISEPGVDKSAAQGVS